LFEILDLKDASNLKQSRNFSHHYPSNLNYINNNKVNHDKNIKNELNYMITTYKGQSGSPLFIRIKNEKLIDMKRQDLINCTNDKYSLIFLGLHSRSPEFLEPINKQKHQNCVIRSNHNEIKPNINEKVNDVYNLGNQNKQKTINININLNEEFKDINININLNSLIGKNEPDQSMINQIDHTRNSYNLLNENNLKKELMIKDFLIKNNYCSYNVGLKIDIEILNKIKKSIIKKRSNKKNRVTKGIETRGIKTVEDNCKSYFSHEKAKLLNCYSSYMLINIHIYEECLVKGIFNVTSYMKVLFEMASEYLEVDKKYILIHLNNEFFGLDECGNEFILRYFQAKGILNKIINDKVEQNTPVFREIINANFVINIDKYSDFISDKLFSKLRDNIRNFDDNEVYDNSEKSNLKTIVRYIFTEIQTFFEKSQTLHGLLFKAIKAKMIKSS